MINHNKFIVAEPMFHTIQGLGRTAGKNVLFIRLAGCNLRCSYCLDGQTVILMGEGLQKLLKDVSISDVCISPYGLTNVTDIMSRQLSSYYIILFLDGRVLKCSLDHPFVLYNGENICAKDLLLNVNILCIK